MGRRRGRGRPARLGAGPVVAFLVLGALLPASGCAPDRRPPAGGDGPGLVVLVVVDQLRSDHLTRNRDLFSGGFRTLQEEGRGFAEATVDHAVTNSGPGHATLATGRHPSGHGIVDNSWVERAQEGPRVLSAVGDPDVRIVGDTAARGRSPARRLVGGLADWARAADPGARAVSIGQAPHSANAMAAREGGHAYWFSGRRGRFVTSTWYRNRLPAWVEAFHRDTLPALMADSVWELGVAPEHRGRARPDRAPFEADGVHTTFPHAFTDEVPEEARREPGAFGEWFATTPMLDEAILALARAAVRGLEMGRRGATDVLTLNLSSTDEAGHAFGPRSLEQMDAVLRLDRALDGFLGFLDRELGRDGYLLALSADHGAADVPEADVPGRGRPPSGVRVGRGAMVAAFDRVVEAIRVREGSDSALAVRLAGLLEDEPFVADVLTPAERAADAPTDTFPRLYRNSHHPERGLDFPLFDPEGRTSPGVYGLSVRLVPGAVIYAATSVHGSPYPYDRTVPIHFLGAGVAPGEGGGRARTVDVAPTLAALSGLPLRQGLEGRVLDFVYGDSP